MMETDYIILSKGKYDMVWSVDEGLLLIPIWVISDLLGGMPGILAFTGAATVRTVEGKQVVPYSDFLELAPRARIGELVEAGKLFEECAREFLSGDGGTK